MNWDYYEFRIAEHFLSALIDDDYSGMDDAEETQFREWLESAQSGRIGHWTDVEGTGEDWGRCAITGLFAMRCTVRFMFRQGATA